MIPVSALTLLVGQQEGHPAYKNLDDGLFMVTIWLKFCISYSPSCHHHFHLPNKIQNGDILLPAHPGTPEKRPSTWRKERIGFLYDNTLSILAAMNLG